MPIERLALAAMGTRFELVLAGAGSRELRAAGEDALESVAELHRLWSVFDRGSLISRVNRLAAERPVALDGETLALLLLARELWAATGGAFDPTLGARMRAAGFRGERATAGASSGEPAPSSGMAAVEVDGGAGTVRLLERGIELDLGGIAKGFALDRAGERLRAAGVDCALLHGGTSSAVAIGAPPDTPGWSIALDSEGRRPRVCLRDAALGVSGADRGHILDPATGRSAPRDSWSAVVADSAAVADGWSTALVAIRRVTPATVPATPVACATRPGDPPSDLSWLATAGGQPLEGCDPRGVFA